MTVRQAIEAVIFLDSRILPKPSSRNPASGISGINQAI